MFPSTKNLVGNAYQEKKEVKKNYLCICKTLNPLLKLIRFVGFFPVVWTHEDGTCAFKKSIYWLIYTIFICFLYIFQIARTVDFPSLVTRKSLPIMLNDITNAIYGVYIIILTLTNFYRHTDWIKALNNNLKITRDGILCQSAMRVILNMQYGYLALMATILAIQSGMLTFLHFSNSYQTDFDYNIFINKIMQNIPFVFYTHFFTIICFYIGMLACFEKLTINCLRYTPVHPMKGIDETNNTAYFFGLVKYERCKDKHPCSGKLASLPAPELVEHLRILHEDISLGTYEFNACMNPQFLVHTVVELTVLIVHCYSVIAYIAYDFKSPFARTVHVLNCVFVVLHTIGLFLFLKNAQALKNMIQGLTNFLLEYSTRITSSEEHQQVRIFLEKLKQHRPFTANGVFTIDLSIAGPISANILTYVLVALQFDIAKE